MDRDVGFNPRRGGNCWPALLRLLFVRPKVIRFGQRPLRGYYRKWFRDVPRLLPTERETKVMSHGRSISVLPNDMVAGIMFPDLRVAPLSSLSAQRIIARGIDDVIVGGILHDAMRGSLCTASGPLFPARIANRIATRSSRWQCCACPPLPKIDGQVLSRETCILLYAKIINMLAGREAERLFPHQFFMDASGDIKAATFMARFVTSKPAVLLDLARIEAGRIVSANKHQVEAVASALLESKTLTGAEIDDILAGMSPALRAERLRRKQWKDIAAGAALFTASHGGLIRLYL